VLVRVRAVRGCPGPPQASYHRGIVPR
jgi:hypothetical protein